jgi:hypothetical protein
MNWFVETWRKMNKTLPQPLCHNTAFMAAQTLEEHRMNPVLVWDSPEGKPGHMQCKVGDDWVSVTAKIYIGKQEKEWEGTVYQKTFSEYVKGDL